MNKKAPEIHSIQELVEVVQWAMSPLQDFQLRVTTTPSQSRHCRPTSMIKQCTNFTFGRSRMPFMLVPEALWYAMSPNFLALSWVGTKHKKCSYQRINNSYACHNQKTQNGLLKGELGFEGFIVTDWTAIRK